MQIHSPSPLTLAVIRHTRPYVELHGVTDELYYFRKASTSLQDSSGQRRLWHPRIRHTLLRGPHLSTEGILYIATPKEALTRELRASDLLYIGCSASGGSRFWRGRPSPATRFAEPRSCFHHEQMRRGREGLNLEEYLRTRGAVVIRTLTDEAVQTLVSTLGLTLPAGRYPSHQLERAVLSEGFLRWAWNARL